MKPNAILAITGVDVERVARATGRPDKVVGLHFPPQGGAARLLGLVRGDETSSETIVTVMRLARTIGRIAVVSKPCPDFFGRRMLAALEREAQALVLEGSTPWQVDRLLYDFGFPRGPFAAADLAGLDVSWGAGRSTPIAQVLCAAGRRGKESGAGYYDYGADGIGEASLATERIVMQWRRERTVDARTIPDDEILHRCIHAVVNEAADILDERKAIRASDIDIAWIHGYGWPAYRGGPTYYADRIGLEDLLARMKGYRLRVDGRRAPARLLKKLAAEGMTFADL
jgi:3-hydroxyacyl-CoA dehydrogenase